MLFRAPGGGGGRRNRPGALPAAPDTFPARAQRDVSEVPGGERCRFCPAASVRGHGSRVVPSMAGCNADGLVVKLHKKRRNGEYNSPAMIYYYRSNIYVLSHMKNVVHKLSFGLVVFPFLPKVSVEEKGPSFLSTASTSSSEKETGHSWNYYQNSFVSAGQEARLHCFNGIFLALNL